MNRREHDMLSTCPHCGRVNDVQAGVTCAHAPRPGDVSMCEACAGLAFFTEDGMRKPTPEELAALLTEPAVRMAVALKTGMAP